MEEVLDGYSVHYKYGRGAGTGLHTANFSYRWCTKYGVGLVAVTCDYVSASGVICWYFKLVYV